MARMHCGLLLAALLMATGCRGVGQPFGMGAKNARSRLDIARLHERDGQLAKARELYGKLHGQRAHQSEVCQRLAIVNSKLGDFEAARGYFEEAVQHDPDNAEVLTDFGYALLAQGEYDRAETLLGRALKLDAQNRRAANNLGLAVAHQGRSEEALKHFRRANGEAAAHANLAYVLAQRGEGQLAIAHYSHALSLDSELPAGQQGLLQIAQMQRLKNVEGGLDASNIAETTPAEDDGGRVAVAENVAASSTSEADVQLAGAEQLTDRRAGRDLNVAQPTEAAPTEAPPANTTEANLAETTPPKTTLAETTSADATPVDAALAEEALAAEAHAAAETAWENHSVERVRDRAASPVPATTTHTAEGSSEEWGHVASAERTSTPESSTVVPVEFTETNEEGRDGHSADKVDDAPRGDSVITAPTWVADPDDEDVSDETSPSPEVSVRWQQLTISHDRWGGRHQALDVCHRAALDLARNVEFAEVIRKYSDDDRRAGGGHVDWTVESEIDEELRSTLTRLAPGVISRIISGENSYRLVRVTDRRGTPN